MACLLIVARADVNRCSREGQSPLRIAALEGHQDVVFWLLAAGAETEKSQIIRILGLFCHAATPLWVSCKKRCVEIVSLLIAEGANTARKVGGQSPVDAARTNHHPELVRQLQPCAATHWKAALLGTPFLSILWLLDVAKSSWRKLERFDVLAIQGCLSSFKPGPEQTIN